MPLTYQNAYGGPGAANPLGKGFYAGEREALGQPLPNLEDTHSRIRSFADRPDPVGTGPCPLCGGRSNLIIDPARTPNPGAIVEITHATIDGALRFALPDYRMHARVKSADEERFLPLHLAEIAVFTEPRRVFLAYRAEFERAGEGPRVELRMVDRRPNGLSHRPSTLQSAEKVYEQTERLPDPADRVRRRHSAGGNGPASSREEELWRHRNLGKALYETPASVPQSAVELKKALDLAPGLVPRPAQLRPGAAARGRHQAGQGELEKAQKQEPNSPYTWFNLGVAYKREGMYPEAIRQFERMVQLVPSEPVSHYNLGLLYNLTERPPEALKQFEIARELDPKLVAPRFQIYNAYRLAGKEVEAKAALAEFLKAKDAQKAADDSEDMEWCYYAELYDPIEARPAPPTAEPTAAPRFSDTKLAGTADPKTAGMLVMDTMGDGSSDLVVWSSNGIRVYRKGKDPVADSGLGDLKGVLFVAAGDFENSGLAGLCVLTEKGPLLYRNVKGKFVKVAAQLPTGRFERAVLAGFRPRLRPRPVPAGREVRAAPQRRRAGIPRLHRPFPLRRGPGCGRVSVPPDSGLENHRPAGRATRITARFSTATGCAACSMQFPWMLSRPARARSRPSTSITTVGSTWRSRARRASASR